VTSHPTSLYKMSSLGRSAFYYKPRGNSILNHLLVQMVEPCPCTPSRRDGFYFQSFHPIPYFRSQCALPSTPLLLVLGQPYPRLSFLHQNATSTFRQCVLPTSPSLIFHLVVLMHASSKIVHPLKYLICGTSLTFAPLFQPLREIRAQDHILCSFCQIVNKAFPNHISF
jgi:hypothetical protein